MNKITELIALLIYRTAERILVPDATLTREREDNDPDQG